MELILADIQPNFPNEDLSDGNAAFLELLMQNRAELQAHHTIAENNSFLYRYAHPALVSVMQSCFRAKEDALAFEHGVEVFESVAGYVTLSFNRVGHSEAAVHKYMSDETKSFDPLTQLSEARDRFVDEMQNTTTVVHESAKRLHPGRAHFAIGGAAMTYILETDIINRPDSLAIHKLEGI